MHIEFDGEAWDTEERILGELIGLTVELHVVTRGDGEDNKLYPVKHERIDCEFLGTDMTMGGTPMLNYRVWDEAEGAGTGPRRTVEYERVVALKVY